MKKVLILGAGGMTGTGVLRALANAGMQVTAFDCNDKQSLFFKELGAAEVIVGNMENRDDLENAMKGKDTVYHITSAFNPNEYEIGKLSVDAAKACGIGHFVYQSVLHSNMTSLIHHWKKNQVEEYLIESGVPYTIVQPTIFMQNILRSWEEIKQTGVFRHKFYTEKNSALAMVDLGDFAQAVAMIMAEPARHIGATYEMCGPQMVTAADMKQAIEGALGRSVEFSFITDEAFEADLRKINASDYKIQGMTKMYGHYNAYDFPGSPFVLEAILGRKTRSIAQVLNEIK